MTGSTALSTAPADTVVPSRPTAQAGTFIARSVEYTSAHPSDVFPSGRVGGMLYNRDLVGMPFVICSDWLECRQEARTLKSGAMFDAHQVVQVYVARLYYNAGEWELGEPEMATLSGEYLLNQFRSSTPNDLVLSQAFTIAENPEHRTKGGGHPKMLKRYIPDDDGIPGDDDDDFIPARPSAEQMGRAAAALGLSYDKPAKGGSGGKR